VSPAPDSPEKEASPPPAATEAPPAKPAKDRPAKAKAPSKGKATKAAGPEPKGTKKPVPDNPNFRYIVRFAGFDLDGQRSASLALTGVPGVGRRVAEASCRIAGINPGEMLGNLPEPTVDGLETIVQSLGTRVPPWIVNHRIDRATGESQHLVGVDLETSGRDDVNLMKMVRSYKGVRHERGQKVRGQRTRSNGRTGMAAGVLKKAAKEAAAAAAPAAVLAAAPAKAEPAAAKK
jgi:small subunit ribosomal protein S13